jgi:beta-lactamase regulating signal transducer with metallopeptidase domain
VALCLRLVPRTTAAVRFAIWTAVFAVLAVLPLLHAYTLQTGGVIPGHGAVLQLDVRWSFAIAALWLIVSLVRAVKLAMSAVRLRGIWKRAVPVVGCDEVLDAAGFRGVELCTSKDVDRPSVIGFFSPRILIPEELFARLTTEEFGQIVLHEVGHLRRADDWINLLQKLSLVLVPLNPVLMWIERRLCLERELACDDDVLRLTKAPKAYATCLTNLAEDRLGRRAAALSLGAWER